MISGPDALRNVDDKPIAGGVTLEQPGGELLVHWQHSKKRFANSGNNVAVVGVEINKISGCGPSVAVVKIGPIETRWVGIVACDEAAVAVDPKIIQVGRVRSKLDIVCPVEIEIVLIVDAIFPVSMGVTVYVVISCKRGDERRECLAGIGRVIARYGTESDAVLVSVRLL